MKKSQPIVFSGHNDRAVFALCRFFNAANVDFHIVARDDLDVVFKTVWKKNVIYTRKSLNLDVGLMRLISQQVSSSDLRPLICQTSEFLNNFALENRRQIEDEGWYVPFPPQDVYRRLTNKESSPELIRSLIGLKTATRCEVSSAKAPCVLKPRSNIINGKICYPIFCETEAALDAALARIQPRNWIAEDWIDGDGMYFCAYLDKSGKFDGYWQENLMQQPDGKSIVLARTAAPPSEIDVVKLMQGLHKLGYFGPFMMEIMLDHAGNKFFIEINPRFWGPLNLALKANPLMLQRYAKDVGMDFTPIKSPELKSPQWYAWAYGAQLKNCRRYSGLRLYSEAEIDQFILKNDIYADSDTIELANKH